MKKLFSIFCCLLLSASMVTQAGQTSITQNFTWAGWWTTEIVGTSGSVKCIRYQFNTNTANTYPRGRFVFVYTASQEASYSGRDDQGNDYTTVVPPVGTYTIGESTSAWTAGSYDFQWNGSYYNTLLQTASSTYFNCTSGTITVSEGADGPYMVFSGSYKQGYGQRTYGNSNIGTAATYRTVTVASDDNTKGTVSYANKSGYVYAITTHWKNNSVYTLTATPKSGYRFVCWKNGSTQISTNAVTDVTITGNATYTAYFELDRVLEAGTVTAEPDDEMHGTVTGGGSYAGGTEVTLTASPLYDYRFIKWSDGDMTNPRTVTVDGDATYTAEFGRVMQINIPNAQCVDATSNNPAWFQYIGEDDDWRVLIAVYSSTFGGSYTESDCALANCKIIDKAENETIMVSTLSATTWAYADAIRRMDANITGDDGKNYHVVLAAPQTSGADYDEGDDDLTGLNFTTQIIRSEIDDLYGDGLYFTDGPYMEAGLEIGNNTYMTRLQFVVSTSNKSNLNIPTGVYPINNSEEVGTARPQWQYNDYRGVPLLINGCSVTKMSNDGDFWFWMMRSGVINVINKGNGNYYMDVQAINSNGKKVLFTIGTLDNNTKQTVTATGDHGSVTLSATSYANQTGTGTYQYGTRVTLTPVPASGYEFAGWTGTDVNEIREKDGVFSVKVGIKNLNVTPVFVSNGSSCTYEVEFDANGGSGTMPNQEFTCGEAQNLNQNAFTGPAATITYNYHGATSGNGTPSVTVNKPFGVWEDSEEESLWDDEEEVDFSVSDGTTVTMTAQWDAFPGVTLPTPEKTGHTFNGWYTEETGGTKKGNGGANFVPAASITLHAQWTANTYNVSFAAGEGSGTMTDQVFTYGVAQNLKANTFTAPTATATYNYNGATGGNTPASVTVTATADGWFDGNSNYYEEGQSVNNLTATNGATVAMTANWDWTEEITLPTPTKAGYEFDQWSFNMGGMDLMEDAGAEIAIEEDVEMTALWNIVTYNLTYAGLEGATNTNPTTYNVESETITLAAPGARDGWTFTGWTISGTPVTEITHGSTGDKTLTANWTESITTYSVQFLAGAHGIVAATAGGSNISSGANVDEGTEVTLTATAKNFYHFKEWRNGSNEVVNDANTNGNTYTVSSLAGDVNLTAVFERDEVISLVDDKEAGDTWYNDYAELVEDVTTANANVNVRYERNFSKNTWSVFALPFDYVLMGSGHSFAGNVYELASTDYDYDTDWLSLNFMPVTTILQANRPYLFYSSGAVNTPVFGNVTLSELTTNYYNVTNTGAGGSIDFRNTTYRQYLEKNNPKVVFITNNKLYYMGNNNVFMRAFRGYFYLNGFSLNTGVAPRVRIVLDGQTATELEVVSDIPAAENGVRKYMENGTLVIEREGVKYDATGAKIN